uniref:Uncharacterized protein n=1 Tax=Xenopsylla cheopis TaxID=163159 RepID=A0A6M2DNI7_XENCH
MAGGIDTSGRKPRRTWGTPAYKARNNFALGGLAVTMIISALFYASVDNEKRIKYCNKFLLSEEEKEERLRMSLIALPKSSMIQEMLEEEKDY